MIMEKHLERMTLREKCAQMVFIDFRFEEPDFDRTMHLVKKDGVGGVCLFGGSIFDEAPLVNSLQRGAKFPLLMASDFENGAGHQVSGATVFPPNLAVGATGSEELAQSKGRLTAREARALGVRWVLAPVVDVNANPENPVINTRSFGDDPALVTRLAAAFVKGLHEMKALACAKHFPGHGDVAADSHLELPVVEASLERLRERDLKPFAELAADLDGIMTGHLRVPAIDPEAPASLSRAATTLLREGLKFEGLICTDALMMGGIAKHCSEDEAVVRAAQAGADVLLYPVDPAKAVATLEAAVKSGRLDEKAVDRAAERILAAKERLGLFRDRMTDQSAVEQVVGSAAHRAAAQRIAEAAVTLVRGSGRVGPAAAVVRISDRGSKGDFSVFEKELAGRVKIEDGAESGVVAVFFRPRAFAGVRGLDEAAVARVREAQKRYRDLTVVSFGSPYVLRQFPEVPGYVCAYGEDEHSQRAAARALAGEIEYRGKLPVVLGV